MSLRSTATKVKFGTARRERAKSRAKSARLVAQKSPETTSGTTISGRNTLVRVSRMPARKLLLRSECCSVPRAALIITLASMQNISATYLLSAHALGEEFEERFFLFSRAFGAERSSAQTAATLPGSGDPFSEPPREGYRPYLLFSSMSLPYIQHSRPDETLSIVVARGRRRGTVKPNEEGCGKRKVFRRERRLRCGRMGSSSSLSLFLQF